MLYCNLLSIGGYSLNVTIILKGPPGRSAVATARCTVISKYKRISRSWSLTTFNQLRINKYEEGKKKKKKKRKGINLKNKERETRTLVARDDSSSSRRVSRGWSLQESSTKRVHSIPIPSPSHSHLISISFPFHSIPFPSHLPSVLALYNQHSLLLPPPLPLAPTFSLSPTLPSRLRSHFQK